MAEVDRIEWETDRVVDFYALRSRLREIEGSMAESPQSLVKRDRLLSGKRREVTLFVGNVHEWFAPLPLNQTIII